MSEPTSVNKQIYQILSATLSEEEQETITEKTLLSDNQRVPMLKILKSVPIEIESGKTMNINPSLALDEQERLITLLKKHKGEFS